MRRIVRLDETVDPVRAGRTDELEHRQKRTGDTPTSSRPETRTADGMSTRTVTTSSSATCGLVKARAGLGAGARPGRGVR